MPATPKPARQPGQGAQVLAAVVTPFQGQHRLCGQSQFVRHGHTDAAIADVEGEITRLVFQFRSPGFQLNPARLRKICPDLGNPARYNRSGSESSRASPASINEGPTTNGMVSRRRKSRKRKSSGAAGVLLAILLVSLLAAGAAAWLILTPFGPTEETFVELPPGSSTLRMGRQLESAGVVRSRYAFDLMRWWKRGTLRAGEYRFDHPATVVEVYARIARGDVFYQGNYRSRGRQHL